MKITLLMLGVSLIVLSCTTVPNNRIPVEGINRDKVTTTVDLESVQIEVEVGVEPPTNPIATTNPNNAAKNTTNINTSSYFDPAPEPIAPPTSNTENIVNSTPTTEKSTAGYFVVPEIITDDKLTTIPESVSASESTINKIVDSNILADDDESVVNTEQMLASANISSLPAKLLYVKASEALLDSDYKKANFLLDRALTIAPDEPTIWHKKAEIMFELGKYKQAITIALQSNSLQPNSELEQKNLLLITSAKQQLEILAE